MAQLSNRERMQGDLLLKAASHGVIERGESITAQQAIERASASDSKAARMFLLYNRDAVNMIMNKRLSDTIFPSIPVSSANNRLREALDVGPLLARVPQSSGTAETRYEIIIKSFRRFESLLRCIVSIRNFHPSVRVSIADDSFVTIPDDLPAAIQKIQSFPNLHWHWLPFDSGLGAGRNYLVQKSTTPIIFNFDDDFLVTEETDLAAMANIIEQDANVDLLGGLVRSGGLVENWCGQMQIDRQEQMLKIIPLKSSWKQIDQAAYRRTDLAFNFFAARRKTLLENRWDDQFKIVGEHLDHFLALHKNKAGVYYTNASIIAHIHDKSAEYKLFRNRTQFLNPLLQKWGLRETPNHPATEEAGFQRRDMTELVCKALSVDPNIDRPNLIVLGVGHSNTSITTRQIHALGWQAGDADEEYAESVSVREVNIEFLKTGAFPAKRARQALANLPKPWAIKDPRFCRTLPMWMAVLQDYSPFLLWIKKDLQLVQQSYHRRDESPDAVEKHFEQAQQQFESWPFDKLALHTEAIEKAVALFDSAHCNHLGSSHQTPHSEGARQSPLFN